MSWCLSNRYVADQDILFPSKNLSNKIRSQNFKKIVPILSNIQQRKSLMKVIENVNVRNKRKEKTAMEKRMSLHFVDKHLLEWKIENAEEKRKAEELLN